MVNGDLGDNWPIIERFGVDAIPHLAMVGADGQVETALIGPIPKGVLREDLNVSTFSNGWCGWTSGDGSNWTDSKGSSKGGFKCYARECENDANNNIVNNHNNINTIANY